jgi:hypothetical protein
MRTVLCLLVIFSTVLVVGCGADEPSSAPSASEPMTGTTTGSSTAETASIVGRWERTNECPQLVEALNDAGLGAIAPAVAGDYFPGVSAKALAKKDDVCEGAEPFVHSHFFDAAGNFGSLDENENQVDDGTYEIIDADTFRIGNADTGAEFHYEVDGDTLTLSPVITKEMIEEALAHPLDFSPAGWSVAVSYPGQSWKRTDCGNWC